MEVSSLHVQVSQSMRLGPVDVDTEALCLWVASIGFGHPFIFNLGLCCLRDQEDHGQSNKCQPTEQISCQSALKDLWVAPNVI